MSLLKILGRKQLDIASAWWVYCLNFIGWTIGYVTIHKAPLFLTLFIN